MGGSPGGQGVITASSCGSSWRCYHKIRLYREDWIKEEYGIRRDFHKCARIWVGEVTEEDGASWLVGCRNLLCVFWTGCLAAMVQVNKKQRVTGLLAGKPVPEITWHGKASAEMSALANICILFAFREITYRSKIIQALRIGMGIFMQYFECYLLAPQPQVLAGIDFSV